MSQEERAYSGEYRFLAEATAGRMSPSACKRLHQRVSVAVDRKIRLFGILIIALFLIGCLGELGSRMVAYSGLPHFTKHIINGLWGGLILWGGFNLLAKPADRLFRKYLAKELYKLNIRPHYCIKCDYSLEGIETDSCPECGEVLASIEDQVEYPSEEQ